MEDQWLATTLADPLPQAGAAHQISSDLSVFPLGHIPGHHLMPPAHQACSLGRRLQTSITGYS